MKKTFSQAVRSIRNLIHILVIATSRASKERSRRLIGRLCEAGLQSIVQIDAAALYLPMAQKKVRIAPGVSFCSYEED